MNEDYPDCGPQVKRPLRIRILQYAAWGLAFAGLILLYLYSVNRDIPVVRVAAITPTMNFAYVRISGEVSRDTYVFKSGGMVFNVHDGSGEIAVMGGRAQAEALAETDRLPRAGDRVEVAGSLSLSADDEVKLRMQSADQLTLHRKTTPAIIPEESRLRISDITAAQKGDAVALAGTLKEIVVPGPGSKAPYVLTLEQGGAELDIIFWDNVFQGLGQTLPIPGKLIRAHGRVEVYKGRVQLNVRDANDLKEMDELVPENAGAFRVEEGE